MLMFEYSFGDSSQDNANFLDVFSSYKVATVFLVSWEDI